MKTWIWVLTLVFAFGFSVRADDKQDIEALKKKVDQLASVIARRGKTESPWRIGGYGELHYNHQKQEEEPVVNTIDFHRFVLFFGYRFNDKFSFVSELEIEHAIAGEGKKGEVEIEQAYVNYHYSTDSSMKLGLQLVPVGIMNETHEPPSFYGVERNPIEKHVLPSTWWASGIALTRRFESGFEIEGFLHEGLLITDSLSIRKGRQKSSKSKMDSPGTTIRLASGLRNGFMAEGSIQYQDDFSQGQNWGGDLLLVTANARFQRSGMNLTALYAYWSLGGDFAKNAGKDQQDGGYLEISYKFNSKIGVYTRYNKWSNTASIDEEKTEAGVNYWLYRNIVCKFDLYTQDTHETKIDGLNIGFGYHF